MMHEAPVPRHALMRSLYSAQLPCVSDLLSLTARARTSSR